MQDLCKSCRVPLILFYFILFWRLTQFNYNGSYQAINQSVYSSDITLTSLPKVIWEQGRVAAAVPGAGWHKGLRIRNVCIVLVKDRCANERYFSVRKQE